MKNRQSIPAQLLAPLMIYIAALSGPIFLSMDWQPPQPVEKHAVGQSQLAVPDRMNWVKSYREDKSCSGHSLGAIWCDE